MFLVARAILDGSQTCQLDGLGQLPPVRAHPLPSSLLSPEAQLESGRAVLQSWPGGGRRRPIWGAAQIQKGRGAEPGPGSGLGGGDMCDSSLGSAVAVGSDG